MGVEVRKFWLLFLLASPAAAQDVAKLKQFANNFSHENLTCGAYSLFVHQCLKNRDANDPVASRYLDMGNEFLKRGIETGKLADVSEKAITAKVELAIGQMKEDTEESCVNISVLFQKYAKACRSLYEDGPARLSKEAFGERSRQK